MVNKPKQPKITITVIPAPPISTLSDDRLVEKLLTRSYGWDDNPLEELRSRGPISDRIMDKFHDALIGSDKELSRGALSTLTSMADTRSIDVFITASEDPKLSFEDSPLFFPNSVAGVLGKFGPDILGEERIERLRGIAKHGQHKNAAIRTLGLLKDKKSIPIIADLLAEHNAKLKSGNTKTSDRSEESKRKEMILALGDIGDKSALPLLFDGLGIYDHLCVEHAIYSIAVQNGFTHPDFPEDERIYNPEYPSTVLTKLNAALFILETDEQRLKYVLFLFAPRCRFPGIQEHELIQIAFKTSCRQYLDAVLEDLSCSYSNVSQGILLSLGLELLEEWGALTKLRESASSHDPAIAKPALQALSNLGDLESVDLYINGIFDDDRLKQKFGSDGLLKVIEKGAKVDVDLFVDNLFDEDGLRDLVDLCLIKLVEKGAEVDIDSIIELCETNIKKQPTELDRRYAKKETVEFLVRLTGAVRKGKKSRCGGILSEGKPLAPPGKSGKMYKVKRKIGRN